MHSTWGTSAPLGWFATRWRNASDSSSQTMDILRCRDPDNRPLHREVLVDRCVSKTHDVGPLYLGMALPAIPGNRAAASPITIGFRTAAIRRLTVVTQVEHLTPPVHPGHWTERLRGLLASGLSTAQLPRQANYRRRFQKVQGAVRRLAETRRKSGAASADPSLDHPVGKASTHLADSGLLETREGNVS